MAVLEFYYDQTHPFCFMETKEELPSIITPVQPSTTIADTSLLSEEETCRQMSALYNFGDEDDIVGMSLLQMSSEVQNLITETGQWPEDGIGVTGMLGKDVISEVMDYRNSFYKMNKIGDKLAEANAHMAMCSDCSPPATVPVTPLEAHSVRSSSAETNTGDANTGVGSGTNEANGSAESGVSSATPEETTEATV
jgi:hypothetical protein